MAEFSSPVLCVCGRRVATLTSVNPTDRAVALTCRCEDVDG